MEQFFTFLETHTNGVLILLVSLVVLTFIINYIAKIFNWGRYKNAYYVSESESKVSYVIVEFFVRLINDFKHFLALTIVLLFTGLILLSMMATNDFDQKMEALQLVIASLGGLLGSIIGYYFGESAAKNSLVNPTPRPSLVNNGQEEEPEPTSEPIIEVVTPEMLLDDSSEEDTTT